MTRVDPRGHHVAGGWLYMAAAILYRTGYALNISFETMILPQLGGWGFGIPLFSSFPFDDTGP